MESKRKKLNIYDIQTNVFIEFFRGIKLGLTNLWRNKALSLATILVIAIMLCIFNSILAVNVITNQALNTLSEKVDIVVYLKDDISFYDATSIKDSVSKLEGVKKAEYISKDDALKTISKTYPETASFFLKFNLQNPLPPSINIVAENAEDHERILNYLNNSQFQNFIEFSSDASRQQNQIISDVSNNLISLNSFVKQLIFWIVLTFIIGGSLIILNAVQLTIFYRRHEINIMRLVGATPNFIRLPFITEGALYGFFAVILSFIMLFTIGKFLEIESLNILGSLTRIDFTKIFFIELALTMILGIISSFSTVEHYLKRKLLLN